MPQPDHPWRTAWLDAAAFAGGLALAWFDRWNTTDLVWSLWLSSLVVGYATLVWGIFGPAVFVGTKAWQDRSMLSDTDKPPAAMAAGACLLGGLFLLAFFTVHFGLFHFVHSMFLQTFFPIEGPPPDGRIPFANYGTVVQRYWIFLPMAFLAERQAFRFSPAPPGPPDTSVKAADIEARKKRNARQGGMTGMMAPYKNVIRMHLLIFFFAGAHFAGLDSFVVYAVVYAVYFFPWRLLRRESAIDAAA